MNNTEILSDILGSVDDIKENGSVMSDGNYLLIMNKLRELHRSISYLDDYPEYTEIDHANAQIQIYRENERRLYERIENLMVRDDFVGEDKDKYINKNVLNVILMFVIIVLLIK